MNNEDKNSVQSVGVTTVVKAELSSSVVVSKVGSETEPVLLLLSLKTLSLVLRLLPVLLLLDLGIST